MSSLFKQVMYNILLLLTLIILPVSSSTSSPSISPNCWMDLFLGHTYYLNTIFFCLKVEFFTNGKIYVDKDNQDCTAEDTSSNLKTMASYQNSTNKKSFFSGEWTGEIYFLEDLTLTEMETVILDYDSEIKKFEFLVMTPHCAFPSLIPSVAPSNKPSLSILPSSTPSRHPTSIPSLTPSSYPTISSNCWTGIFYGRTLFYNVEFFCLKIDIYPNGNIAIDKNNLDCTSENASTNLEILAPYQYSTNKAVYYNAINTPDSWTGKIYFTQDSTLSEVIPNLVVLDGLNLEIVLDVQFPHCAFPSFIPSSPPSLLPSSIPSKKPSSPPSKSPSSEPTSIPSTIPTNGPTSIPSTIPTSRPTSTPSLLPTNTPSIVPTLRPSSSPSLYPSELPSLSPSSKPSTVPSIHPSDFPSLSPSSKPTNVPSISQNCNHDIFIGRTLFMEILFFCVKAELKTNGTVAIDPWNHNCTSEDTTTNFHTLSYYQNSTNKRSIFDGSALGSNGWNGQLFFTESDKVVGEDIHLVSFDAVNRYFAVEIVLSSCVEPSLFPSSSPTLFPTLLPSYVPSKEPSNSPSKFPSLIPSNEPSIHPTDEPSKKPSYVPTANPSLEPSVVPTLKPSLSPSTEPSNTPTITPTSLPSVEPSSSPSNTPTTIPTYLPSVEPSISPSNKPSIVPSVSPSNAPSQNPSTDPTTKPTSIPSVNPISEPSTMPSFSPSTSPSSIPSSNPTLKFSMIPSTNPSMNPSMNPSFDPTTDPTSIPSLNPTSRPSISPSTIPTQSSIPSSVPSLFTRCFVENLLGNNYYTAYETAFVRIFYRFRFGEDGSFSAGVENINHMDNSTFDNQTHSDYSDIEFSHITKFVNYTENLAFFEDNDTKWNGYFAIKENPQLDSVELEFIMYDTDSMTFAIEVFFPSCTAPSIVPSAAPTE